MEGPGGVDGVLAHHGIDDQVDLVGVDRAVDRLQLLHERIVDMEATRGVQDEHVDLLGLRGLQRAAAQPDRDAGGPAVLGALVRLGVEHHLRLASAFAPDLVGHDPQLLDRRGTLKVGGRHHHALAPALEVRGELAAGGRLAGALQTAHHHDGRCRLDEHDVALHRPHQLDEAVVDDTDHLLTGLEAPGDVAPDRLGHDLVAEVVDDVQVDVRLQKRGADLGHRFANVVLADPPAAREPLDSVPELLGERLEHGRK